MERWRQTHDNVKETFLSIKLRPNLTYYSMQLQPNLTMNIVHKCTLSKQSFFSAAVTVANAVTFRKIEAVALGYIFKL